MNYLLKTRLLLLLGSAAAFMGSGCSTDTGDYGSTGYYGGSYYGGTGYYDPWHSGRCGGGYYGGGGTVIVTPPGNYNRPNTLPFRPAGGGAHLSPRTLR